MDMDAIRALASIHFANDWWVLALPASLMLIDILTGVIHAWAIGHLKSYRMREGLLRKYGELVVLISFELLTIALELPPYFMAGVSGYIIFMELVSLLENLSKIGVPLPSFLKKALGVAEGVVNGDELDDEAKAKIKEAIDTIKKKEG